MRRILRASAKRFWIVAAALAAINVGGLFWIRHELSPKKPTTFRIAEASPQGDADDADRLAFTFDRPLAPLEAVAKPITRAPFELLPEPAGHWEWAAPDRVEFILAKPLPPGRLYRARATDDLIKQAGLKLAGESEFVFRTRRLQFRSFTLESADPREVLLNLKFNQRVDHRDLLRALRLSDSRTGAPLEPSLLTQEPAETFTVRIARPRSGTLAIRLAKGLRGYGGELGLRNEEYKTLTIAQSFALLRPYVNTRGLGDTTTVNLVFSDELDHNQRTPQVRVEPSVQPLSIWIEGSNLLLRGPFEVGAGYRATVASDVLSRAGQLLGEEQSVSFNIPIPAPSMQFPIHEGILSPEGNLLLDLKAINLRGIELSAARLHSNNLLEYIHSGGNDYYYHRYGSRNALRSRTSRQLLDRTIALDLPKNKPQDLALDLRELLTAPLGVYQVWARAKNSWAGDSMRVMVTDLGITSKRDAGGMFVWVSSIRRAQPIEGAMVSALTYNNQTLASSITSADGTARLDFPDNHPDGAPYVVIAERGDDMSYLIPQTRAWVIEDVDQTGSPFLETYEVMLYPERGVYRPGDTVRVTGIVRDALGNVPPPFPLMVTVIRPGERVAAELPVVPEPEHQGMFHLEYPTREDSRTGTYRFSAALPGSEDVLGSVEAKVEAFLPVRMEVKLAPDKTFVAPGEQASAALAARYLFGQPAAGLNAIVNVTYERRPFRSKRLLDFTFDSEAAKDTLRETRIEAALDGKGKHTLEIPGPVASAKGFWRGRIAATVTEPGGRSVSSNATIHADTAGRYVGLYLPSGKVAPIGAPFTVEWAQRTGADEAAPPGPMTLTLSKITYQSYWADVSGRRYWKSTEDLSVVESRRIEPDAAEGKAEFTCPDWGHYRLLAVDQATSTTASLKLYASDYRYGNDRIAMERPERLEIVLDQPSYAPGATAKALVRSPIAGTLMLTLETNRVLSHRVIEMEGTNIAIDLPVDASLRGGAYVSASVVRAVDPAAEDWMPHRALGLARLTGDHSANRLPLVVEAPMKALPGSELRVAVQTNPPEDPSRPGVVHLWAVDEGILLTTNFETPDPHAHFFAPRRSFVTSADLFSDLLPDNARPESIARIGAGEGGGEGYYRSGVSMKQREPAVIWRTLQPVGADGRVTASLTMPPMTGELRIIAVAVDGDRYGSAEHRVSLAPPLIVEAAWPRFAAPGDEFAVPVKLFNSTGAPLKTSLNLTSEGPVEFTFAAMSRTITISPETPATVWLHGKALAMGEARARLEAESLVTELLEAPAVSEAQFAIRPVTPVHTETIYRRIEAGESATVVSSSNFITQGLQTVMHVGAQPSVELRPALEQLIDYPYGCAEQTTSKLWAIVHAADLMGFEGEGRSRAIGEMVQSGINRLWSMQAPNGGIAYWSGSDRADTWVTAYAAGALLEAKRAGYKLNEDFLRELAAYLETELGEPREFSDANMKAQLCYVLAGFDRPQHAWMTRLSEQLGDLDIAGRAYLAGAWLAAGMRERAVAALGEDTLTQSIATTTGGRLTSQTQQEAVLLNVLIDLDPEHEWIPELVRRLEASRRASTHWGSTLSTSQAISALTRYQVRMRQAADFEGTIRAGADWSAGFDETSTKTHRHKNTSEPIAIESFGEGTIFAAITYRGLLKEGEFKTYDRRMQVRREWKTREGKPADPEKLRVGDLVIVEVTLIAPHVAFERDISNIVIVDALPGGMEVENPRLSTSDTGWGEAHTPDRVEFLDDRVLLFAPARADKRTFRYALRAVGSGSYSLPPIQAECMYDTEFASIHGGGRVVIAR